MFLILGMRWRVKVLADGGTFHCTRCGGDRPYRRVQRRRWFTVFFVPVVPLGAASTVVRCEACGTSFEDAALALPTAQEQAVTALDALRAVAAALIAMSAQPAVTTAAAVRMLRDAGLPGYGDTDLAWDLQSRAGDRAIGTLTSIAPVLPLFDRERFLTRAATIGLADGTTTLEVLGYLHRVGTTLDLSKAHIDGVIGQVRSQTAS